MRAISAMKGGPTIPLALDSDGQHLGPADLDRALRPFREIREAVGMEMQFANDVHSKWNSPIAPHDATGPVNIFACSQICLSSPNTMMQEHVPAFYKGWYNEIVGPNLDIRDGYLHALRGPAHRRRVAS